MQRLRRLAGGLDALGDAAGGVGGGGMLALGLRMAANVLLRYLFSIGSVAAQELEWHLMSPIVLIGMAYALLHDGHLRVDLIYVKLPERARLVVNPRSPPQTSRVRGARAARPCSVSRGRAGRGWACTRARSP